MSMNLNHYFEFYHSHSFINSRLKPNFAVSKGAMAFHNFQNTSFIRVCGRLHLALHDKDQAEKIAQHDFINRDSYIVVELNPEPDGDQGVTSEFVPSCLSCIHNFCQSVEKQELTSSRHKIIFCTRSDTSSVARSVFLIGCYLIMGHNLGHEETFEAFRPVHDALQDVLACPHLSIKSCWRALHHAKTMGWVDFRDPELCPDDEPLFEEYLHYARCLQPCTA